MPAVASASPTGLKARMIRRPLAWAVDYLFVVTLVIGALGVDCWVHRLRGDQYEWMASAFVQWLLNLGLWWSLFGFFSLCQLQAFACRALTRRTLGACLVGLPGPRSQRRESSL